MTGTGTGKLVTREMDFRDFKEVEISHVFEYQIYQSDSYGVSITTDENLFNYITARRVGDRLELGLKTRHAFRSFTLKAEIAMPELCELRSSGATRGTVKGFNILHPFALDLEGACKLKMIDMSVINAKIDLSGACSLTGDLKSGEEVRIDLSGACRAVLKGSADDLLINCDGVGSLDLSDFTVHSAKVDLDGISGGTINLDGRLDASLGGFSRLLYAGNPTLGDIRATGFSTVKSK